MTKYYAELDRIRFHYDSETDKASIATSYKPGQEYDVTALNIEDLRGLNRYLQQVLEMMEQRKWEEMERSRGPKICHDKE